MEQHHKRYKCSHKEFYRWMVSEIDDFFPAIVSKDPLKRFYHLLDTNHSTSPLDADSQKLVITKHPKAPKRLKHGPTFSVCNYWKEFSSQVTENILKFLDIKDIIMLIYTCKYFKETLDQESTWKFLQIRDFSSLGLKRLKDDTKDRVSEKIYYKYLHLSIISGIPYHTGYFKAYGSPDVVELSESIVDFLSPKTEMIKNYVGEILVRNQCKTFDLKLSWLKEKNEICLWNGNSSLEFKTPEVGNEVEIVNKFYPCFIKRYSMVDGDEEIVDVFFLEDKYLVVKLQKKEEETERVLYTTFRTLNLEEELYSIAKGLESAIPFDYSFLLKDDDHSNLTDIKTDEFGVDFAMKLESGCDLKVKLLLGDRVVFYTENSVKPTLIFWDLKEKKKIDFVSLELQKPLDNIIVSKKSDAKGDKVKLILLDENMNVYCGLISEKDGFTLNQTIILPTPAEGEKEEEIEKAQEDNTEKLKELEAKYYLNIGKNTRSKYMKGRFPTYLPANSLYDVTKHQLDPQFTEKTRRYSHEIVNKTKEEWLIVHVKNNFHFVNLDEGKIYEFKDTGLLTSGNWTVYEDNLLITNPIDIFYYRIDFENHSIDLRFSRKTENLSVEDIGTQWIVLDSCFAVLIFTHMRQPEFTTKVTIVVTSTQEFLYNQDPTFNSISYKAQVEPFICALRRLERNDRDLDIKFENSKVLVSTDRASFYFDMNLSAQHYNKVYLNGWMLNKPIHNIRCINSVATKVGKEVRVEEETNRPKQKMVNNMKLKENPNTMNAKEKNNGWKKGGKSQSKKDEDKEYKVLKGKGDKYHKNLRQGQRSEKVN